MFWQFPRFLIFPLCSTSQPTSLFSALRPKARCAFHPFDPGRGPLTIPPWFAPESGPVGSPMRSNSASAAKIFSTNHPCGVVVSIESVRLRSPTLRFSNSATSSNRFFRQRPNRQTAGAIQFVNTDHITPFIESRGENK